MTKIRQEQISSGAAAAGEILTANGAGGASFEAPTGGSDEKVKVSADETAAGYLEEQFVAGSNVTIQTLEAMGNKSLQISVQTVPNHDHSGDAGDGAPFDAANLGSGASGDGQVLTSDGAGGSAWEDLPAGAPHDAVTLDADAAAVLDLNVQEIGLDVQNANKVFAGPATGADNEPTFRALVAADIGSGAPDGTKFLRDDLSWQAAGGGSETDLVKLTFAVGTTTSGQDTNRTTGGAYTNMGCWVWVLRPIKLSQVLWDIKNAATYTLTIKTPDSSATLWTFDAVVVSSNDQADVVFTPPGAPILMMPGIYYFLMTANASVTWSDHTTDAGYYLIFDHWGIIREFYNGAQDNNFSAPIKLVFYLGSYSIVDL
jgi:hypothetical protein